MKRGLVVVTSTIAVLTLATSAQAQGRGRGGAPACTTVQCDVLGDWGRGYALLGNAGEFLDPVFSSGVTIAFKSASLAAAILPRQIACGDVDWQRGFAVPLKQGIDTFRAFVESWYRGGFQRIIFHPRQPADIRRMIAAVLAGYAWDRSNPYVREPQRRLAALEALCG